MCVQCGKYTVNRATKLNNSVDTRPHPTSQTMAMQQDALSCAREELRDELECSVSHSAYQPSRLSLFRLVQLALSCRSHLKTTLHVCVNVLWCVVPRSAPWLDVNAYASRRCAHRSA